MEEWLSIYDLLRQAGERLRKRGVNWIDGTTVFGADDVSVMVDLMHLNAQGQDRLARFMAERIMAELHSRRGANR